MRPMIPPPLPLLLILPRLPGGLAGLLHLARRLLGGRESVLRRLGVVHRVPTHRRQHQHHEDDELAEDVPTTCH